jgi:hypothetical protein
MSRLNETQIYITFVLDIVLSTNLCCLLLILPISLSHDINVRYTRLQEIQAPPPFPPTTTAHIPLHNMDTRHFRVHCDSLS